MESTTRRVNSYNIYDENHYSTILYHAIARDEEHVKDLARETGINLDGLTIEEVRINVKDELGRPCKPCITDALVY